MMEDDININNNRAAYNAIVDLHNNLIQTRFNVAGLVLAGNGFLASGFFQQSIEEVDNRLTISILALVLTVIFWIMEVRTYSLLHSLGNRGTDIEKALEFRSNLGYFSLMKNQEDSGPKFLIFRFIELKPNNVIKFFFSHSFGIGSLYLALITFWLFMIFKI